MNRIPRSSAHMYEGSLAACKTKTNGDLIGCPYPLCNMQMYVALPPRIARMLCGQSKNPNESDRTYESDTSL